MIEKMSIRNLSPARQRSYNHAVKKFSAALTTAYAAGLRVSEVVALRIADVDSRPPTARRTTAAQSRSPADYRERVQRLTGQSLKICPACGGPMMPTEILPGPRQG